MASGRMNATTSIAAVTVSLDGRPLPVNLLGTGDANWATEWRTVMELLPGPHTLVAVAQHSSGMFTTNKSITFTNNAIDQTTLSHFAEGQLSYRVWKNSAGQTNRIQTFKWDSRSRLLATTELDAANNGYDWSAVYDALGRRLQTTTIIVTNGYSLTNQPKVIDQFFDPSAEFLEAGVKIEGKTTWKIYGPDLDGRYGGMNGTGGLEGTTDDLGIYRPLVSDGRGNVHGTYDPANGSMLWNSSRPTGYGAVPEYRPTPLSQNGSMGTSSAWAGRWPDLSGLYWLGARYYDPVAGRFISCDPLGHDADPSLYAFANGDPVNYFDPDGRFGKQYVGYANTLGNSDSTGDRWLAMPAGLVGAVAQGIGSLPGMFNEAGADMAAARQEISGYSGGQAFLARSLMMPADVAFGTTKLIGDPYNTVRDMPQGFVNFGGKIGADVYNVGADPSVNTVFNIVEDTLGVLGLTQGGVSLYRTGSGSSLRSTAKSVAPAKRTSGTTVLGHAPAYERMANKAGARYFKIPDEVWAKMTPAERWAANQKFLDRTIARGDEIVLSTRFGTQRSGSYFDQELQYLISKGYTPSADGMKLLRLNL